MLAERDELRQKVATLTYELADANQRALASQVIQHNPNPDPNTASR